MFADNFSLAEMLTAQHRIAGTAIHSPLRKFENLNQALGFNSWLKLETMQPIGAFKIRGACNAVQQLSPEQAGCGVVCCSTGNHGRAVAYAARAAKISATVCLSALVPEVKIAAIEQLGATVKRVPGNQIAAMHEAARLRTVKGMIEIPPFDHRHVIVGQASCGLEILHDLPNTASIVIPLSGGGLLSGVALAAKKINPKIRIIGVSMERGAAMAASLKAERLVDVGEYASLADCLSGGLGEHNQYTFELCKELIDETVLVSETEIRDAMLFLFESCKLIAEGGAVVGIAAVLSGKLSALPEPVVFIISGENVDMAKYLRIINRKPLQLDNVTI